jgi:hypothetical protein
MENNPEEKNESVLDRLPDYRKPGFIHARDNILDKFRAGDLGAEEALLSLVGTVPWMGGKKNIAGISHIVIAGIRQKKINYINQTASIMAIFRHLLLPLDDAAAIMDKLIVAQKQNDMELRARLQLQADYARACMKKKRIAQINHPASEVDSKAVEISDIQSQFLPTGYIHPPLLIAALFLSFGAGSIMDKQTRLEAIIAAEELCAQYEERKKRGAGR